MSDPHNLLDRFQGCLLAAAIGDALCADREGGLLERMLWKLIGRTWSGLRRHTDDTLMTMDLAAHLIREGCICQDVLAREFARSHHWSRGYGPSTAAALRLTKAGADWRTAATARHPSGSFGNGAAMRIAPVALFHHDRREALVAAVEQASVVTHLHPAAIAGAQVVAHAIVQALHDKEPIEAAAAIADDCRAPEYADKLKTVHALAAAGRLPDPAQLSRTLGMGSAAVASCPAATLIGLHFMRRPLEHLIGYVRKCRGDTDTVAAMAGAIWGAGNGVAKISPQLADLIEGRQTAVEIAAALHRVWLTQRKKIVQTGQNRPQKCEALPAGCFQKAASDR